jgi:hypothetical protein
MPAVIYGIRPGDQKLLDRQAEEIGLPARELAGRYLEEAIRRVEADRRVRHSDSGREPADGVEVLAS